MMVITLLPRPTSPWRTPDAGVGRKASKVTLLQMSAEQQPCSKAFRRLLRQPWTLSVILVRMDRGLCPGETSSVMTYRLASPATASRTSWKQFARSGTTLTSLLRMLCAASPVASSCTRPNLAGFPVGIALVTVNSSSSPTTSVSSTTSHAAELIIRPSPLRLRAAPVLLPLTLQPPQHQLRMHLHPRLPHPVWPRPALPLACPPSLQASLPRRSLRLPLIPQRSLWLPQRLLRLPTRPHLLAQAHPLPRPHPSLHPPQLPRQCHLPTDVHSTPSKPRHLHHMPPQCRRIQPLTPATDPRLGISRWKWTAWQRSSTRAR